VRPLRSEGQNTRRAELEAQRRALAAACTHPAGSCSSWSRRPAAQRTTATVLAEEEALPVIERADRKALVAAKRDPLFWPD
jgi:hypothetical protein